MHRILHQPSVMTIRLHSDLVMRALQAVRVALYAIVVMLAVLDIAIAVLALVAIWAWSQLVKGTQS